MKKSALGVIRLLKHNNWRTVGHTIGPLEFTACVLSVTKTALSVRMNTEFHSSNGLLNK